MNFNNVNIGRDLEYGCIQSYRKRPYECEGNSDGMELISAQMSVATLVQHMPASFDTLATSLAA